MLFAFKLYTFGNAQRDRRSFTRQGKHRHPLEHTLKDQRIERAEAILVDSNNNDICERKQITVFLVCAWIRSHGRTV